MGLGTSLEFWGHSYCEDEKTKKKHKKKHKKRKKKVETKYIYTYYYIVNNK